MTYALTVLNNTPKNIWMLDNPSSLVDITGNGGVAAVVTNDTVPAKAVGIVAGMFNSSLVKNTAKLQFTTNVFAQEQEFVPFAIEAWVMPIKRNNNDWVQQQVLGHKGYMDGLSIQGSLVKFTTSYANAADAVCSYDMKNIRLAHIVGIHNVDSNRLYVNGDLVSSVDLTTAQKTDSYVYSDGTLLSGAASNTQELAISGVGIYRNYTEAAIKSNYAAGNRTIPQDSVIAKNNGQSLSVSRDSGAEFATKTWAVGADFFQGRVDNISIAPEYISPVILSDGTSTDAYWYTVFPLASAPDTIYGVMLEWYGYGFTVAVSLDGSNWTSATNGNLVSIIGNNFVSGIQDLHIRVYFPAAADASQLFLESITAHGYGNANVATRYQRPVSISWPTVLREDYEPTHFRDDNGARLFGTTLTIGVDADPDALGLRTFEMWIKPLASDIVVSGVSGTQYVNTVQTNTLSIGEWCLVHIVAASNANQVVTVTGNAIVGQIALYPTALTVAQIIDVYKSYLGYPIVATVDSSSVSIVEQAVPASLYSHAWSEIGVS